MYIIKFIAIYLFSVTLINNVICYPEIDTNFNINKINDLNINKAKINIINDLSWDCANNATCVNLIIKNWLKLYKNNGLLNFGLFSVEKNVRPALNAGRNSNKPIYDDGTSTGRAVHKVIDFLKGNALRFPFGPMVFSLKRSDDSDDYLELALLKKVPYTEGRGQNRKHGMKEKKQMQMFIPLYLAATTFGWTLVAAKAVGILTIKALLVSKLAFLVAAAVIVKKVMDSASEKMLMPPHHQYMMPYSMDYGLSTAHSEMPHDFYNVHYHPHVSPSGYESMAAAESHNHPVEVHLNSGQANTSQAQHQAHSQVLAALANNNNQPIIGQNKVKRNDQWNGVSGTKSMLYNFLPGNTPPMYIYRK